jgi:hypothetical protein
MPTTQAELDSLSRFVHQRLGNVGRAVSLDELFHLWHTENRSDKLYPENVAAIRASIKDFKNDERGEPAGAHAERLRREFGMAVA